MQALSIAAASTTHGECISRRTAAQTQCLCYHAVEEETHTALSLQSASTFRSLFHTTPVMLITDVHCPSASVLASPDVNMPSLSQPSLLTSPLDA